MSNNDDMTNNDAPLFTDGVRDQLLVEPFRAASLPKSMVFAYSAAEAEAAVRQGQDDAIALLTALAKGGGEAPELGALSLVRRPADLI